MLFVMGDQCSYSHQAKNVQTGGALGSSPFTKKIISYESIDPSPNVAFKA